jgi:hypothetical protein
MLLRRLIFALAAFAVAAIGVADSSDICFQAPRTFAAPGGPLAIAAADFDGDGNPDVVVGNSTGTVSVLLGDGKGGLGSPIDSSAPVSDSSAGVGIAIADFNRDGKPDVAVGGSGGIDILLGAFGGKFAAPVLLASTSVIQAVTTGDFNGDGFADVAGIDYYAGAVLVFYGDGAGGFATGPTLLVGSASVWIAAGDLDGDGRDDIVVSGPQSPDVLAFRSLGNAFDSPKKGSAGQEPGPVAIADFTGDGHRDVLVGDVEKNLYLLPGDGAGGFGPARRFPSANAQAIAIADVNGDGRPDAVVNGSVLSVLLGDADGTLSSASTYLSGSVPLAIADFNLDGHPDVVQTFGASVQLYLGDGTGRLTGILVLTEGGAPMLVGDLNNDGFQDVVTVGAAFLGGPGATFAAPIPFIAPGSVGLSGMALADVNRDGALDLAISSQAYPGFAILLGNGKGGFAFPHVYYFGTGTTAPAFGDFNGDGWPDLALAAFGQVLIELNERDGTFRSGSPIGTSATALAVADFNGDGKADLVVANVDTTFQIFLGKGNGEFEPPATFDLPALAFSVVTGDFNGDGHPDVALSCTFANAILTFLGDGAGGVGTPSTHTLSPPVDVSFGPGPLTSADFDGDGHLDLAIAATTRIAILRGDGSGGFSLSEIPAFSVSVAAADVDRDGRPDLVSGLASGGGIGALLNILPLLSPAVIPNGTVGVPYPTTPFEASGGLFPIPLSFSGTLPPGLQFALPPGGVVHGGATLAGTPTEAGTFTFTVTAENLEGCMTTREYSVAIALAPAEVVLTISPNPAPPGPPIVLTVTVGPTPPGGTPATGNVTFRDGDIVLGVVPLVDGVAMLTIPSFSEGHHNLTATYDGDANFAAATSGVVIASVGVSAIPDLSPCARILLAVALAGTALIALRRTS